MKNNSIDSVFAKYDNIVLASKSPRRLDILRAHGIEPVLMPTDVDETLPGGVAFCTAAMILSKKKATATVQALDTASLKGCTLIIAADTVVYKDEIMGKPVDEEDAKRMLSSLRNSVHQVATGVTLMESLDGTANLEDIKSFVEVTEIVCSDYSDKDIEAYIKTGEPFDKAGSYAIQGGFRRYISEIRGDYENVVGLPYNRIVTELGKSSNM